ncbi:hypothetical protein [Hymenobacter koreensis]|uniref:hypothetical protein n=1 Tax=Hymenobacter koreensis TaxID=1084523 RepID=UPI0031E50A6D
MRVHFQLYEFQYGRQRAKKKPSEIRKAFKSMNDFDSVYQTNSLPPPEHIIVPVLVIKAVGEEVHGCAIMRLRCNITRNYKKPNQLPLIILNKPSSTLLGYILAARNLFS